MLSFMIYAEVFLLSMFLLDLLRVLFLLVVHVYEARLAETVEGFRGSVSLVNIYREEGGLSYKSKIWSCYS